MLDPNIEYKRIIMRCDEINKEAYKQPVNNIEIKNYKIGDEKYWAQIQRSVGALTMTEKEAENFFKRTFLTEPQKAEERCLFIADKKTGEYIAACSAWFAPKNKEEIPLFHWLAVREGYEGRGLARIIITAVMQLFEKLYPEKPIYLSTQPASYKAIKLYFDFGFKIVKSDTYDNAENQCLEALPILKKYISPDIFSKINDELKSEPTN